jgi:uncharacterized membrane protein
VAVDQTQAQPIPDFDAPTVARGWWGLVLAGGLLGIVGTVWQTVERLSALSTSKPSVCDINAVISCGSVYSHWQSSALGVPNSLIGLPVFAIMTSAAVGALLGSRPSKRYVGLLLGLGVFMTLFVVWYMEQTAFAMGALCLFCTASMVNIILIGIGLTRVADAEGALGEGRLGRTVHTMVDSWADLAVWIGLMLLVGVMLFLGLAV